ncbi:RNA polymerase II-associated protein 3 [Apodemus speciosus]|uniref:RNA polymerase II-associated protein 3 n=1 Tax=Apodemus speciosus TaxID=105296 RepID=A0ABQ0FKL8_APOSI
MAQVDAEQEVRQPVSGKASVREQPPPPPPGQSATALLPPVPANSFQLESDFRQLRSSPEMLYQYIKGEEKPALIFEVLERLSHLRRFDMAVMFMSGPERKAFTNVLFNHLEKSEVEGGFS